MGWRVFSKYLGVSLLISTLVSLGIIAAVVLINGISWPWWAFSIALTSLLALLAPMMLGRAVLDHQWQLPRGEATRRALLRLLARWLASTAMVTTMAVVMPVSYFPLRDVRLMVAATSAHVVMFTVFGIAQLFEVSKDLRKAESAES